MSPTMGNFLGGESVKVYGNTLVGIVMIVTRILVYDLFINHLATNV